MNVYLHNISIPSVDIGLDDLTYIFTSEETCDNEDVVVDVFHLYPAVESKGRVSPHPVHQVADLQHEWRDLEAEYTTLTNAHNSAQSTVVSWTFK